MIFQFPVVPSSPDVDDELPGEVRRACARLLGMTSRLDTVQALIPIDATSAARRVRAAVAELDRIVAALEGALPPAAAGAEARMRP